MRGTNMRRGREMYTLSQVGDYGSVYQPDPYVGLPIEAIAAGAKGLQDTVDKNQASIMEIAGKEFGFMKADTEKARAAQEWLDTRYEKIAQKHKGHLSKATLDVMELKREAAKRFGAFGDIGAMQSNLASYQSNVKELDEQLKKGDIDKNTFEGLLRVALDRYKGIGEGDQGVYNAYQPEKGANFADIPKQVDELSRGFAADKVDSGVWRHDPNNLDKYEKKTSTGWTKVDESEVYNAILPMIMQDPNNQAYAQQQTMLKTYGMDNFTGVDEEGNTVEMTPEEYRQQVYNSYFTNPAEFAASKRGFTETRYDEDLKTDPEFSIRLKKKLDDEQIPFTAYIETVGEGSKFSDSQKIHDSIRASEVAAKQVALKAKYLTDENGDKVMSNRDLLLLANAARGDTSAMDIELYGADPEKRSLLLGYLSEIKQQHKIKEQTEAYDRKIRKQAGVDRPPTKEEIAKAGEDYETQVRRATQGRQGESLGLASLKRNKESIIQDLASKNNPNYKDYKNLLEENAKNNTETIGLTTFNSKSTQNILAAIIDRDLVEGGAGGGRDLKTGEELSEDDYETFGKTDPKSVGYFFEGGKAMIGYRPTHKDDKTKQHKYVKSEAPSGVLAHIIRTGDVTAQQVAVNQLLDTAKKSADGSNVISYQDPNTGEKSTVVIRSLTKQDRGAAPAGKDYKITLGSKSYYYTEDEAFNGLIKTFSPE